MKNISVTFKTSGISLPLSYQYGVQSLLYNILRNDWHDAGMTYGNRTYKLFTFSSLRGNKTIADGKITFTNEVYLDIRGVRDDFCDALILALNSGTALTLLGQPLSVQSAKWNAPIIETNQLRIKMLSPVTVHRTDGDRTYYYTPLDSDFSEQVNDNFRRKYTAYTDSEPVGDIKIVPLTIGTRDKYVTTFKDTHVTGWRGEYELHGRPEYLTFLYYCGLGARNSGGFGMFDRV